MCCHISRIFFFRNLELKPDIVYCIFYLFIHWIYILVWHPSSYLAFVIHNIIKTLKLMAPGYGKTSNITLKTLPFICIIYITKLKNSIFKLNYFPKPWKSSAILPISKSSTNLSDEKNYIPKSLLPSLNKVIERVIRTQ